MEIKLNRCATYYSHFTTINNMQNSHIELPLSHFTSKHIYNTHPSQQKDGFKTLFYFLADTQLPAYLALAPISSSMRMSWLYFERRSERQGAPVLILPEGD